MSAQEIVILGADPSALPQRRRARSAEPIDVRLLRNLQRGAPDDLPPISEIGFEVALSAMAEATKAAIVSDLDCYLAWFEQNGRTPFPASPEDIVRYVRWLEDKGFKPSSQARRVASIARAHRLLGFGDKAALPTQARMVLDALKSARRRQGVVQRQAAPLRFGGPLSNDSRNGSFTIDALLAACGTDFQGLRDAALISVGYDAGLRVSELVSAKVEDIEPTPDGAGIMSLPFSKTDQEGEGLYAWLSPDSMRRIQAWLEMTGIEMDRCFAEWVSTDGAQEPQ